MPLPTDHQPYGFMSLDGAAIPRKIGRHRIVRVLGRGSMGMVFLGRDPYIDRDCGLEAFPPGATVSRLQPGLFP